MSLRLRSSVDGRFSLGGMVAGSGADTSGVPRAALWNLHPALQLLLGGEPAADY